MMAAIDEHPPTVSRVRHADKGDVDENVGLEGEVVENLMRAVAGTGSGVGTSVLGKRN